MGIFCKELNKEFPDSREMFKALKANADTIVAFKKARMKFTDPVNFLVRSEEETKAESPDPKKVGIGDYIYPVINTTNFLDSHNDVHIDGIWDVSIKDQKNKLYYIINHDLEIGKVVAYPNNVEAFVKTMTWEQLGQPYTGKTQALIFKVLLTEATNKDALYAFMENAPVENSVRMRYISTTLCINDDSPDFKQEYENFYKYLAVIANKDDAMDRGYFWAVTEAAIHKEGSAVLFGSNEATPILYTDPQSSSQDDNKSDPPLSSHKTTEAKDNAKAKSLLIQMLS